MKWLLDTGILLRMTDPRDGDYAAIADALRSLRDRGDACYCATQNVAEFWSASTRPAPSRGGFGLSTGETRRRLELIELQVEVLREPREAYATWKRLLLAHDVSGRQVHDCRLVAVMNVYGIADILTLNPDDFRRYPAIRTHTPADVAAGA